MKRHVESTDWDSLQNRKDKVCMRVHECVKIQSSEALCNVLVGTRINEDISQI